MKKLFIAVGGVRPIQLHMLRLLFALMFFFLSFEAWSTIIAHQGPWEPVRAAAWAMWGAYSIIAFIGIRQPLKMLPIVLFEIIYKVTWLVIVAWPLYGLHLFVGKRDGMTSVYVWVIFPIVAMPWRYFFKAYIWDNAKKV